MSKKHNETPEQAPEKKDDREVGLMGLNELRNGEKARKPGPESSSHPHIHAPENAADKARDLVPSDQGTLKPSDDAPAMDKPEEPQPQPEEPAPAEPTQSAAVSIPYGESRVLRIQGDGEIRGLIEITIDDAAIIGANMAGLDYPALRVRGITPGTTTLRVAAENENGDVLKATAEITVEECRGPASSIDLVEVDVP
jgi:hypothetical protein